MGIRADVLANYVSAIVAGSVTLLLMPVYARLMGAQAWGGVALCLAAQSLIQLWDLGLSQVVPRDVAQAESSSDPGAHSLHAYGRLYAGIGAVAVVSGLAVVQWFGPLWVPAMASDGSLQTGMKLAVLCGALQLMNGLPIAYWNGSGRQVFAVKRTCSFLLLRGAVILAALMFLGAGVEVFMWASLCTTGAECISNLVRFHRETGALAIRGARAASVLRIITKNWPISVSILMGALVSQADKMMLPRSISVEDFGVYAMTLALGLAFLQLQYPVMTAMYPRVAVDPRMTLLRRNVGSLLVVCALPCLVAGVCAPWFLPLYIGEQRDELSLVVTFDLILFSAGLNAVYHAFYQYMVAAGDGRWIAVANGLSLIWVLSVTLMLASDLGVVAGGLAWAGVSSIQLVVAILWWRGRRGRK